jgi:hypothetical protein
MSRILSWFRSSTTAAASSGFPPSPSPFPCVQSHALVAPELAPGDSAPYYSEFATAAQLTSILSTIEQSGPVKNRAALPLQLRLACQQGIDFTLAQYRDQLSTLRYIVMRTYNQSLVILRNTGTGSLDHVLVIDLNPVNTLVRPG